VAQDIIAVQIKNGVEQVVEQQVLQDGSATLRQVMWEQEALNQQVV